MLYTILCYNSEDVVGSWTKEHDDDVMAKLTVVQDRLAKRGKLGPVARLANTSTATTLHKHREPFLLTDGPYAETKEQILGFYVIDCDTQEEAVEIARDLGEANPGGAFEIRPLTYFQPGSSLAGAVVAPNASQGASH
jgi:hypothetical protein